MSTFQDLFVFRVGKPKSILKRFCLNYMNPLIIPAFNLHFRLTTVIISIIILCSIMDVYLTPNKIFIWSELQ